MTNRRHIKFCGSTSTATRTLPRSFGAVASIGAQKTLQIRVARRAHQQPKTVPAAHHGDRRFGRAEQRRSHPLAAGRRRRRASISDCGGRASRRATSARAWSSAAARSLRRDDERGEPAEGRQAGAAALLASPRDRIAPHRRKQGADHRMIGLPGLHEGAARRVAAPGAARHLLSSWNVRSAARGSPFASADIRVDHADQRQKREMMALGDELRADDDIEGAAPPPPRIRAAAAPCRRESPRTESGTRASGKSSATSSASRSTPGPQAVSESDRPHSGTLSGRRSTWPQWWQTSARRKRCSTSQAVQFGHWKR